MMKIFTTDKIRKADAKTIEEEPITSRNLMERASQQIANWLLNRYAKYYKFIFLLGKGNNAGDGLAVARMLSNYGYQGYYYLALGSAGSDDFNENLNRLRIEGSNMVELEDEKSLREIVMKAEKKVWVDGLFGSGLSRPIEGGLNQLVSFVNSQEGEKIAVDIPSGLFADKPTEAITFKAKITLSLQFPKLAFMVPENNESVGEWFVLPIGLNENFIATEKTNYHYTKQEDIHLPQVSSFAHKGLRGRCTIIAGGYGRMGAAVLATRAALKSGIGLVSVQACQHCVSIVQNSVPEALILDDENEYVLGEFLKYDKQEVIAFGPAVGFADKTLQLFEDLLRHYKGQLVLDADAITMLAEHKELLQLLPEGTILTPHIGEFDRLIGKQSNHFDRLNKLSEFAKKYKCNVLLKGKHTAVSNTDGILYFNATGNNGMAKGGSGDVLTGMIAGLFPLYNNAFLALRSAVYLHGLAGDISSSKKSHFAMIPSDLVKNLHLAQNKVSETQ